MNNSRLNQSKQQIRKDLEKTTINWLTIAILITYLYTKSFKLVPLYDL